MAGQREQFRLLGFPVHIDPSLFFLLLAFATAGHLGTHGALGFVIAGALSVLTHELGHAVVARRMGAVNVRIALKGMGGLTSYQMALPTRAKSVAIAAAGPLVGLGIGAFVWLLRWMANPAPGTDGWVTYRVLLGVTVGWSLLNLLPVLPLDGGHVLEQLLPGAPQNRRRAAGLIGAAVACVAAVWLVHRGFIYTAVLFGAAGVYSAMVGGWGIAPGSKHRHDVSCDVFARAASGDYEGAAALAVGSRNVHPALPMLLSAVRSDHDAARRLMQLYEGRPNDEMTRSCLALWRVHTHDWPGVLAMMASGVLKVGACNAAMAEAHRTGAFNEAASIGEAMLRARRNSGVAYNTACAWARAGNLDLAQSALIRAVDQGFANWSMLDHDVDLEALRVTPAFTTWRATLPRVTAAPA